MQTNKYTHNHIFIGKWRTFQSWKNKCAKRACVTMPILWRAGVLFAIIWHKNYDRK